MARTTRLNQFFDILKSARHRFDATEIITDFQLVSEARVDALASNLSGYISTNLPAAFSKRNALADYRTNPYVLLTSASVMNLAEPTAFGTFLFNTKLYMALETSFGKSIEAAFVGAYPLNSNHKWIEAPEKRAEFDKLIGLNREEKARQRTASVWREIDKSCMVGSQRYMTSIKSGPNTINDTQVAGMTRDIIDNHQLWLAASDLEQAVVDKFIEHVFTISGMNSNRDLLNSYTSLPKRRNGALMSAQAPVKR